VLAGYPKEMDEFVSVNPGIKRRVTYEFTFPDYTELDLARIFLQQAKRRGFEVDASVTTEQVARAVSLLTTERQRGALNGGVGEHACRHAIFSLNRREIDAVRAVDVETQEYAPSVTLRMRDIEYGIRQVPQVSSPTSKGVPTSKGLPSSKGTPPVQTPSYSSNSLPTSKGVSPVQASSLPSTGMPPSKAESSDPAFSNAALRARIDAFLSFSPKSRAKPASLPVQTSSLASRGASQCKPGQAGDGDDEDAIIGAFLGSMC